MRAMAERNLPAHIGVNACWLLTCIVAKQDRDHYQGPIPFSTSTLSELSGFPVSTLERVRKEAVESGWLRYRPADRHSPGFYEVVIPPLGEPPLLPQIEGPRAGQLPQSEGGSEGVSEGGSEGPSKKNPNPHPVPKRRAFTPPTVEEVRAYCEERGYIFDPAWFVEKNTEQGWRKSGGNGDRIHNWKLQAAVWERIEREKLARGNRPATGDLRQRIVTSTEAFLKNGEVNHDQT
jgi:hypothetical protein